MKCKLRVITIALVIAVCVCLQLGSISVNAQQVMSNDNLYVSILDVPVYDGTPQEATLKVSYKGDVLTPGTDYIAKYYNNVNATNEAKVIVSGKGQYAGLKKTVNYTIQPADISQMVNFEISSVAYNGGYVKPDYILIVNSAGEYLEENVDFVVIYRNNVEVGSGTARLIGLGNYRGYCDKEFSIYVDNIAFDEVSLDINSRSEWENKEFTIRSTDKILVTGIIPSDAEKAYIKVDQEIVGTDYLWGSYSLEPGKHTVTYEYNVPKYKCNDGIFDYGSGTWLPGTCYRVGVDTYTTSCVVNVIERIVIPNKVDSLVAQVPVFQGSKTLFLQVSSENGALTEDAVWASSNNNAAIVEDGIVTLKSVSDAVITAKIDDKVARWDLSDISALTLTKNTHILNYDEKTDQALVTWKNEVLKENEDYRLSVSKKDGILTVTVTGINGFSGTKSADFYSTDESYIPEVDVAGDVNGNGKLDIMDATLIQLFVAQMENFDENQQIAADYDKDTKITVIDATHIQRTLAQL